MTHTPTTLRFGVMCRGTTPRAWQAQTLDRLLAVPGLQPALLIVDPRSGGSGARSLRSRVQRLAESDTTVWDAYNNTYVAKRARSLASIDCSEMFGGLDRIDAEPELRGRFSEHFSSGDLDAIRDHELDFIVRFAYGIIRGDILNAARYGVWSFHHGDEQHYRGSPPALWELAESSPVSGVLLQRLTDRLDGGIVLRKGWFRTTHHSYVANTDRVHFGGTDFPAQVCRDILRGDAGYLDADPSPTTAPIYLKPDDRTAAGIGARSVATFARHQLSSVTRSDQWNVGLVRAPIARFLEPDFVPDVEWFTDDRGTDHYLADPFPLARVDGSAVPEVLVEDYDYRSRRGAIARLDFTDMTIAPVDIGTDAHASYPYRFQADGADYVAAQVDGRRDVELLRISGNELGNGRLLGIDEETLDPTLVEHDGRWWCFFTLPGAASLTELHIWWAPGLFGPWTPHAANPVKTDVRSARPAGTPFRVGDDLYRPAQDCSRTYGGAVAICKVDVLTPDQFDETVVRVVEPDAAWPYPDGIHTLSGAGDFTVIDAKRTVFNRHDSAAELRGRLRRLLPAGPAQ